MTRIGTMGIVLLLLGAQAAASKEPWAVLPDGEPARDATVEMFTLPTGTGALAAGFAPRIVTSLDESGTLLRVLPELDGAILVVDHPQAAPFVASVVHGLEAPIKLAIGGKLQGMVSGTEDDPIPNARVCAEWRSELRGTGRQRHWRRCATSDEEGSFTVRGLDQASLQVTATARGYLAWSGRAATDTDLDVTLEPGFSVAGRIVGPRDEAIPQASVAIGREASVATDREGHFELNVRSFPVVLEVEASGFRSREVSLAEAPEPGEKVTINLHPGEEVVGILESELGDPIPEARFWVERQESASRHRGRSRRITPSEDGAFRLPLDAPGDYRLTISAAGFRDTRVPSFVVAQGERIDLGPLYLARGGGFEGRVVDELSGEPVAAAQVVALPLGTAPLLRSGSPEPEGATTDSDGQFLIHGLEPGKYELRIRRSGFAALALRRTLTEDETDYLGDLALGLGAEVVGSVRDRKGNPRAQLRVQILDPAATALVPLGETSTDTHGRFRGPRLAVGEYRVQVWGERLLLTQEFSIPRGEDQIELELVTEGTHLLGLVTRGEEPVSGGRIRLQSAWDPGARRGKFILYRPDLGGGLRQVFGAETTVVTAQVGSDGTFTVENAPTGEVKVMYLGRVGDPLVRYIAVPDRPEVAMEIDFGGLRASGRILDANTGLGVPGRIRVLTAWGDQLAAAATDWDGLFTLHDLPPGRYNFEASAKGYQSETLEGVAVRDDRHGLEIPLQPGDEGELLVRLTREDGSAMAGVPVAVLSPSGALAAGLYTDGFGERAFTGLVSGSYFVAWSDVAQGAGVSPALQIVSGEQTVLDEVVPRGGDLVLRCDPQKCGGRPVELLRLWTPSGVDLSPYLSGLSPTLHFSSDGILSLGRLSPGSYIVEIRAGGLELQRRVLVREGVLEIAL